MSEQTPPREPDEDEGTRLHRPDDDDVERQDEQPATPSEGDDGETQDEQPERAS